MSDHPCCLAQLFCPKRKQPTVLALWISEFLGTFYLMFLGCAGCLWVSSPPVIIPLMCYTFGLAVLVAIQCFGHISGCHINPQVTLASVMFGSLNFKLGLLYFTAQMIGATAGIGVLKLLVPKRYTDPPPGACMTVIHKDMHVIQGLLVEIVITCVLILVCAAVWDRRHAADTDSVSLRFGFIVACIAAATGPFTGASMNTARSFGPALINWNWKDHWVYWVGPTVGTLTAVFIYKCLFSLTPEEEV